jgi:1-acyl-sn-glycerol-3-phosphate acyltransferase
MSTAANAVRTYGPGASWWLRAIRGPLRLALWLVLRLALRINVEGVRTTGPAVIASNHPNLLDGLLVLMADASMRPIARWHRYRVIRLGLWIGNCVITSIGTTAPLQRGAFAGALAHLHRGGRVWIAPEGGWQPEVTLRPPRTGAVRLAHTAAVPIQVLAICHGPHPGPQFFVRRSRSAARFSGPKAPPRVSWNQDPRSFAEPGSAKIGRWPLRSRPRVVLRWGPCIRTTGDIAADGNRLMAAIADTAGMTWRPGPGECDPATRDVPPATAGRTAANA